MHVGSEDLDPYIEEAFNEIKNSPGKYVSNSNVYCWVTFRNLWFSCFYYFD